MELNLTYIKLFNICHRAGGLTIYRTSSVNLGMRMCSFEDSLWTQIGFSISCKRTFPFLNGCPTCAHPWLSSTCLHPVEQPLTFFEAGFCPWWLWRYVPCQPSVTHAYSQRSTFFNNSYIGITTDQLFLEERLLIVINFNSSRTYFLDWITNYKRHK